MLCHGSGARAPRAELCMTLRSWSSALSEHRSVWGSSGFTTSLCRLWLVLFRSALPRRSVSQRRLAPLFVPALAVLMLWISTAAAHCESFGLSAAAGSKALVQAESVNQTRIRTKTNRSTEVKFRGVISAAAWTCRDVPLIRLCGGVVGKPPPKFSLNKARCGRKSIFSFFDE